MQIMLYYIGYYNQHLNGLTERGKFFSRNEKKKKETSEKFYQHYCLDQTLFWAKSTFDISLYIRVKSPENRRDILKIFYKIQENMIRAMGECCNSSSVTHIKCSDQANIYWCNFFLSSHKSTEGCLKVLSSAMQSRIEKKNKEMCRQSVFESV